MREVHAERRRRDVAKAAAPRRDPEPSLERVHVATHLAPIEPEVRGDLLALVLAVIGPTHRGQHRQDVQRAAILVPEHLIEERPHMWLLEDGPNVHRRVSLNGVSREPRSEEHTTET